MTRPKQEPTDYPEEFDTEFLDYARRALEMAGIETDPKLKETKPVRHSLLHAISEQQFYYRELQKAVPQSLAHWEQSQFMRIAHRCALWDLDWGAIKSYAQFEFLYARILGSDAIPFLPSVFAAAALAPNLDQEFGRALLRTLPDWFDRD